MKTKLGYLFVLLIIFAITSCDLARVLGLIEADPPMLESFVIRASESPFLVRDIVGEINNEDARIRLRVPERVWELGLNFDAEITTANDAEAVWEGPRALTREFGFDVRDGDRWRTFRVQPEIDPRTVVRLSVDQPFRVDSQNNKTPLPALNIEVDHEGSYVSVVMDYGDFLTFENSMLGFNEFETIGLGVIDGNTLVRMRDGWHWPYTVRVFSADMDYYREYDVRLGFGISDSTAIRRVSASVRPIYVADHTRELIYPWGMWFSLINEDRSIPFYAGNPVTLMIPNQPRGTELGGVQVESVPAPRGVSGISANRPNNRVRTLNDLRTASTGGNNHLRSISGRNSLTNLHTWMEREWRYKDSGLQLGDVETIEVSPTWANSGFSIPASGTVTGELEPVTHTLSVTGTYWSGVTLGSGAWNDPQTLMHDLTSSSGQSTNPLHYRTRNHFHSIDGISNNTWYNLTEIDAIHPGSFFWNYSFGRWVSDDWSSNWVMRVYVHVFKAITTTNRTISEDIAVQERSVYEISDSRNYYHVQYLDIEADPGGSFEAISLRSAAANYEMRGDNGEILRVFLNDTGFERTHGEVADFDIVAMNGDRERHAVRID